MLSVAGQPAQASPNKPVLQVRNMFALRAFGRDKPAASVQQNPAASGPPPLLGLKARKNSEPMSVVPPPQLLPNDPMGTLCD